MTDSTDEKPDFAHLEEWVAAVQVELVDVAPQHKWPFLKERLLQLPPRSRNIAYGICQMGAQMSDKRPPTEKKSDTAASISITDDGVAASGLASKDAADVLKGQARVRAGDVTAAGAYHGAQVKDVLAVATADRKPQTDHKQTFIGEWIKLPAVVAAGIIVLVGGAYALKECGPNAAPVAGPGSAAVPAPSAPTAHLVASSESSADTKPASAPIGSAHLLRGQPR